LLLKSAQARKSIAGFPRLPGERVDLVMSTLIDSTTAVCSSVAVYRLVHAVDLADALGHAAQALASLVGDTDAAFALALTVVM